jgi:anaerobic glycerol-3-phosphate dehydrogenase
MTPSARYCCARSLFCLTPALLVIGLAVGPREPQLLSRGEAPDPEELRGHELELQRQAVLQRLRMRMRVVRELAVGKMNLLEAAAWFRDLNKTLPEAGRKAQEVCLPAASTEERCCRQVISWLRNHVEDGNNSVPAASPDCLERQLEEHLRCGPLRLPVIHLGGDFPPACDR